MPVQYCTICAYMQIYLFLQNLKRQLWLRKMNNGKIQPVPEAIFNEE